MGVFEDLGVMVDGLEDDAAEEYEGEVEEIFRFDVFINQDGTEDDFEIEIGVQMAGLEVEGHPEFGEEYGELAQTFADLIVDHIGPGTANLLEAVKDLPELEVELTEEEQNALTEERVNENGAVLLYSFPVLIMADNEFMSGGQKQMGAGFNRSPKADVMLKIYGADFAREEDEYQEKITDAILDHGTLFLKAVEAIQKL